MGVDDLKGAVENWSRFQIVLSKIFSDIESGDCAQSELAQLDFPEFSRSQVFVKADHKIKTTGSIKGRGGVYEVLSFAEYVLKSHGIDPRTHPMAPLSPAARALFERYKTSLVRLATLLSVWAWLGVKWAFELRFICLATRRPGRRFVFGMPVSM
ncbi:hypothetical protein T190_31325 [Sinorhizobium meliloti CCBAU 01290]|nr:hypothetical protein T190_31325 [Sinorhizobium meliloti CCBAU 01290]